MEELIEEYSRLEAITCDKSELLIKHSIIAFVFEIMLGVSLPVIYLISLNFSLVNSFRYLPFILLLLMMLFLIFIAINKSFKRRYYLTSDFIRHGHTTINWKNVNEIKKIKIFIKGKMKSSQIVIRIKSNNAIIDIGMSEINQSEKAVLDFIRCYWNKSMDSDSGHI